MRFTACDRRSFSLPLENERVAGIFSAALKNKRLLKKQQRVVLFKLRTKFAFIAFLTREEDRVE